MLTAGGVVVGGGGVETLFKDDPKKRTTTSSSCLPSRNVRNLCSAVSVHHFPKGNVHLVTAEVLLMKLRPSVLSDMTTPHSAKCSEIY